MKMSTGLHVVPKLSMTCAIPQLTPMSLHDTDVCLTITLGEVCELGGLFHNATSTSIVHCSSGVAVFDVWGE
jgi:hypothetical protein